MVKNLLRLFPFMMILFFSAYGSGDEPYGPFDHIRGDEFSITGDMALCVDDFQRLFKSAFRPSVKNYSLIAASFGLAATMSLSDRAVRHEVQEEENRSLHGIIQPWERYGGGFLPLGIASSLYLGGVASGNSWLRETGREVLISLAVASIATGGLKIIIGRERPFTGEGPFDFDPLASDFKNWSFPSGHTTAAFAVSSVIAGRVGNPVIAALIYGAAGMTAAQRVYDDRHWLSDVLMGAIIGTSSGLFALDGDPLSQKSGGAGIRSVKVNLISMNDAAGIGLACEW